MIRPALPWLIPLWAAIAGCADAQPPASPAAAQTPATVVFAGKPLQLRDLAGRCAIGDATTSGAAPQALAIPWPCQFHRDLKGALRVHEDGGVPYAMVEASTPSAAGGRDCVTHLQALRIQKGVLEVSSQTDRVASCPPFQWDGYVFRGLFD